MAKKKRTRSAPDHHRGIPLGFRADRWRFVRALDAYAESIRRSRNMTMILLIEEVLAAKGFRVEDYPDEPYPDE